MIRNGRKIALPSLFRNKIPPNKSVYVRTLEVPKSADDFERRNYATLIDRGYLMGKKSVYSSWRADSCMRCLSTMPGPHQGDDKNGNEKDNAGGKVTDDELRKQSGSEAEKRTDRLVYYGTTGDNESNKAPIDNKPAKPSRAGLMVSIGIGASFLFGKLKFVLVGLKLTKFSTVISMVLTSATYSLFFGWTYAVGMVGLIFVHECGHAIAMKYYGLPFSPMVFVPFMGAVISMKELPKNSYEEAIIAFGGPVLGSAAALTVGAAGMATDSQLLYALADWGFMINLFNLLPIGSMDGGRICSAISPAIGVLGLTGGGALIYYGVVHNPLFYLIMMAGTYQTVSRYAGWEQEPEGYYKISPKDQASLFAAYLALVAGLILAMKENDKYRKTPKQLKYEAEFPAHVESPWAIKEDGNYDDFFPDEDKDTKWM